MQLRVNALPRNALNFTRILYLQAPAVKLTDDPFKGLHVNAIWLKTFYYVSVEDIFKCGLVCLRDRNVVVGQCVYKRIVAVVRAPKRAFDVLHSLLCDRV